MKPIYIIALLLIVSLIVVRCRGKQTSGMVNPMTEKGDVIYSFDSSATFTVHSHWCIYGKDCYCFEQPTDVFRIGDYLHKVYDSVIIILDIRQGQYFKYKLKNRK